MEVTPKLQISGKKGIEGTEALFDFLTIHRGRNIQLDLENITQLSGRQLELILIAWRQWHSEGIDLKIVAASEELTKRLSGFGVPACLFLEGT